MFPELSKLIYRGVCRNAIFISTFLCKVGSMLNFIQLIKCIHAHLKFNEDEKDRCVKA